MTIAQLESHYKRITGLLVTRTFCISQQFPALVPVADLINHRDYPTGSFNCENEATFCIVCERELEEGKEVKNSIIV